MRKLFDWMTAQDEHGDSLMTYITFAATFVGTILIIGSFSGH